MANQMTISFSVENQTLRRTDTNRIIEKSKNYLKELLVILKIHQDGSLQLRADITMRAIITMI